MKKLLFSIFFSLAINFGEGALPVLSKSINSSSTGFIENKGQIVDQNYNPNSDVKYLLCRPGFNVQLRTTGFSYDTFSETEEAAGTAPGKIIVASVPNISRHYHRVDVELLNCNPSAGIVADGRSATYFNYFTAGTPQGGVSDVHYYQRVIYKNIYPFIDLEFISNDDDNAALKDKQPAEYQFILHAGAKISDIQLSYKGMDELTLEKGELNIRVSAGTFTEKIPSSYLKESRQQVDVHYTSLGNNVNTFSMAHPFTITSDLVIDPTPCFVWGTYYGGNGWDLGSGIALDDSNNVYVGGSTTSTNNIATAGAYQTTFAGGILYDIIVGKFNPTGTKLVWGTYYGGTGSEGENSVAIDTSGVYITGFSHSTTLATPGAWQSTCPNCDQTYCDIIVAKFSLKGALLWGTYYGTSGYGQANDITVNASGVYISGDVYGGYTGFTTPGAWKTTFGGALDAFVAKFNLSGSQLVWGTFYGNNYNALPWGICLDPAGNVYIGGYTDGPDSTKITAGAYQSSFAGNYDGFVAKFDPSGSTLLYGTYYGGPGQDIIYGIKADTTGNVYFTGNTASTSGIATPGAWQTTNGANNAFVAKLDSTGSSLVWGTYYGGSVQEECRSIVLDASKNVYISGGTESPTNIATPCAYQTNLDGGSDAFIAKFNPTGSSLLWGTYYGGVQYDNVPGGTTYLRLGAIALNSSGDIYITGFTNSPNAIASAGAWQKNLIAGPDAFVAKFSCNSILPSVAQFSSSDTTICTFDCINFTSLSSNASSYQWFFQGANPNSSTDMNPQNICYLDTGSYDVKLIVNSCGTSDSLVLPAFIQVKSSPPPPTIKQVGDTLFFRKDSSYISYQWYFDSVLITGKTDTILIVSESGNYNVQVTNKIGCQTASGINVILIGIQHYGSDNIISLSPNPASNQLTVHGSSFQNEAITVSIINMLGQDVLTPLNVRWSLSEAEVDVSKLSAGMYFLQLKSESGSVVKKFVKE